MGFVGLRTRGRAPSAATSTVSECDVAQGVRPATSQRGRSGPEGAEAGAMMPILVAALFVLSGGVCVVHAQGHLGQYAEADIIYGSSIYGAQCSQCHGPNGDLIGGVNLRSGDLKRAPTDNELRGILTTGIPGTAMPAFKFDATEMTGIIAFVRNMRDFEAKSVRLGDAARGQDPL